MELRWNGLSRRLRGRRIVDLRYDTESGFAVVELEEGELWVGADAEGCQLWFAPNGCAEDAKFQTGFK